MTTLAQDLADRAWVYAVAVDLPFRPPHYSAGDWREALAAWEVAQDAYEAAGDEQTAYDANGYVHYWRERLKNKAPPRQHVHSCPECYEDVDCEYTCSVEEDLRLDDGTERGAYEVCERCQAMATSS